MAIETLSQGSSSAGGESFSFLVDYDTVAQTIGLTCTGTGHASLTVIEVSNQANLGTLHCDQYGTTTGQLTNGQSNAAVTYTGARAIVTGPGATGVDSTGAAMPTAAISSAIVGVVNPPKGTQPGLGITLSWGPNSNPLIAGGAARLAASQPSLAEFVKHCSHKR